MVTFLLTFSFFLCDLEASGWEDVQMKISCFIQMSVDASTPFLCDRGSERVRERRQLWTRSHFASHNYFFVSKNDFLFQNVVFYNAMRLYDLLEMDRYGNLKFWKCMSSLVNSVLTFGNCFIVPS